MYCQANIFIVKIANVQIFVCNDYKNYASGTFLNSNELLSLVCILSSIFCSCIDKKLPFSGQFHITLDRNLSQNFYEIWDKFIENLTSSKLLI